MNLDALPDVIRSRLREQPSANPDSPDMVWTGSRAKDGYGLIKYKGKLWRIHRLIYELCVGEIPEGLQIDHVHKVRTDGRVRGGCISRACGNPDHLEPVTFRENFDRGEGGTVAGKRQAAKKKCPRGHPYDSINTQTYRGRRYCKSCGRRPRARL